MANFTIPDVGKKYLLELKLGNPDGISPAPTNLGAAKFHLADPSSTYTAAPRDQLLGDFVECTFAGYAAQNAFPWSGLVYDSTNHWWYSYSKVAVFTSTDAAASHNTSGWYLTDGGTNYLIAFIQYSPVVTIPILGSIAVQAQMDELSQYNN
jgi:hypothetical protein